MAIAVLLGTMAFLVASAPPAGAHSVSGSGASNYRTTLTSVTPPVPGVHLTVIEAGSRLQLENRTGRELVVLGYEDEPYLRVGPDGVDVNTRSPATYLNADRQGGAPVPPEADAKAEPVWDHVSDGQVARWHDHRTHWMGVQRPPEVQRNPDRKVVIIPDWAVQVRDGATTITANGRLDWVPGPSPWPWYAAALLGGAAVLVVAWRHRSDRWLAATLAGLLVVDVIHIGGIMGEHAGGTGTRVGKLLSTSYLSVIAWALIVAALVTLWRRPSDGRRLTALAAVMVAVTGGFGDVGYLDSSTVPFAGPNWLARLLVTVTIGGGVGLAIGVLLREFGVGLVATAPGPAGRSTVPGARLADRPEGGPAS
jgi:hypothetical protein